MAHRHSSKIYRHIYRTRLHALVTLAFVVLPFAYMTLFSNYAHVALGALLGNTAISVGRLAISWLIALVLAWLAAVLFYHGRRATVALPFFDVLQSLPTFAILPLATYVWGVGTSTVVFFLVLAVIWPIFFTVIGALKMIRTDWVEAITMARLGGYQYVRKFILPITLPALVTGSIIGLGDGWEALVATEIINGVPTGLGNFFQQFSHNAPITIFGIIGFLTIIFAINKLVWLPLLEWSHKMMEE